MRIDRTVNALLHPFKEREVSAAKTKHRKANPCCAMCGMRSRFFGSTVQVHHLIPVHVDPSQACAQSNLLTLCRAHHFRIGHLGNYKDYNTNVLGTILAIKDVYKRVARSGKIV